MTKSDSKTRSRTLPLMLLLLGIALIVGGQFLYLEASTAMSTGGAVNDSPPIVLFLADDVVAPLLGLLGDDNPPPVKVARWIRYVIFTGMAIGLLFVVLGARGLSKARKS